MKITFTYSGSPDLKILPPTRIHKTSFTLPDSAQTLPDCKTRILEIGQIVGQLTHSVLHITCGEIKIKNHLIKSEDDGRALSSFSDTILVFWREDGLLHVKRRELKILFPVDPPFHPLPFPKTRRERRRKKALHYWLIRPGRTSLKNEEQAAYLGLINNLADHLLALLNTESPTKQYPHAWQFEGFHPLWKDEEAIKKAKRSARAQARRVQPSTPKPKIEPSSAQAPTTNSPKTGAGRRPGPVPGVFKGVQFRSQLEIRFATQLESKGIRWAYETERLGEGNYLVDFYLPDLKCWVEVKGRFEPRDNYLLRDVAAYLERERSESVFVYTSRRAFTVDSERFTEITHDDFWLKLLSPSSKSDA